LEDILAGNDPDASEELVNECADEEAQAAAEGKTPDGEDLHACKSEDEVVAELPEIDESEWSKEVKVESISSSPSLLRRN
jgi:hypothetical protein